MATQEFSITQTTILPYCWVCKVPFDSSNQREDHHIIPRAYGGVDGPQVSLCDSHHTALNNIALRLYSKRPFTELLTKYEDQNKKLLWLASVVCNARIATENDPNKKQVLVISPKGETLLQLKQLKKVYGNVSRERLIEFAVNKLYNTHFK
jgi:hypothetical protein